MADPTTTALADLARAIGVKPRYTKEERAAISAARQERAERGTRTARAKRNRDLKIPTPVAGTQLLVRSVATEKRHRRCGIDFGPTEPQSFTVSTYDRAECMRRRDLGAPIVSEDEAEQLLADTLLIAIPITRESQERQKNLDEREAKLAAREAEIAKADAESKAKAQAAADEAKAKADADAKANEKKPKG